MLSLAKMGVGGRTR